jgi:hypothetical protein
MADIASGSHRFVAGCARCLRTALAGIGAPDDKDGVAETPRTRQRRGPAFTLAGVRLASSMAVARGSHCVRAALASIPLTDDEDGLLEGDRAGQADMRRRLALASPAVAAGLLAGTVTAMPAQAQEAPTSASPAPAQNPPPAPPPAPPPGPPVFAEEYAVGLGIPFFGIPIGGEVGMIVRDDGRIQFTVMGPFYAGGKVGAERRQARAPGVVGEAKFAGSLPLPLPSSVRDRIGGNGNLGGEFVLQAADGRVGGSWKGQVGPRAASGLVGHSIEVVPDPSLENRGGGQARIPVPRSAGIVAADGWRWTSEPRTWDEWIQLWGPMAEDAMDGYAGPIDPNRFRGVPPPTQQYWEAFGEDLSRFVGGAFTGTPPQDPAWIEGSQIDQPPPADWGQVGQDLSQAVGSAFTGTPPEDPAWIEGSQIDQPAPPDWGQVLQGLQQLSSDAAASGTGVDGAVPLQPGDSAALLQSWQQWLQGLSSQFAAPAPAPGVGPAPGVAPAPGIVSPPGIVPPGGLVPAPGAVPAPGVVPAPGAAPTPPGMTWDQMWQSMLQGLNGPVLVDPELFQDQPASDMEGTAPAPDGEDAPAFEMSDAESDDGGDVAESDDGEVEESDDDGDEFESEDDGDEFESDDGGEDEGDEGGEEESDSDEGDDDGDEFESDDGGEDEGDEGGEEESDSDDSDDGGDEDAEGDDGGESDGGDGGESDGGDDGEDAEGGGGDGGGDGGEDEGSGQATPDAGDPAGPAQEPGGQQMESVMEVDAQPSAEQLA